MNYESNYLVRVSGTMEPVSDRAIQHILENYVGKNTATITVKDIDTNSVNEHSLEYWKKRALESERVRDRANENATASHLDREKAESALAETTKNIDELEDELQKARHALFLEVVDPQWRRRAYTAEDKVVELQAQLDALKTEEEKNAKEAAKSTVSEEYLRTRGGTLAPEFEAVYDALVAKAREQFFRGKK